MLNLISQFMKQVKKSDKKTKAMGKAIAMVILVFFGNIQSAHAADPWAESDKAMSGINF